jgi:hypothetical protein
LQNCYVAGFPTYAAAYVGNAVAGDVQGFGFLIFWTEGRLGLGPLAEVVQHAHFLGSFCLQDYSPYGPVFFQGVGLVEAS